MFNYRMLNALLGCWKTQVSNAQSETCSQLHKTYFFMPTVENNKIHRNNHHPFRLQLSPMPAALLLLLLSGLLSSIQAQCLSGNDNPKTMRPDAAQQLSDARMAFALESLAKISKLDPENNIFFSPHSLHEALGLAYFGSRGQTEASLRKALRVPEDFGKLDVQRFYAFERSLEADRKV